LGIYHYNARFLRSAPEAEWRGYSPKLGRFLSADTIVPGYTNPQHFNRYSYVLGNPLKYTDPTGHKECADQDDQGSCITGIQVLQRYIQSKYKKVKFKGRWDEDGLRKIYNGLTEISGNGFHGNIDAFNRAFGAVTFISVPSSYYDENQVGGANWSTGIIKLEPDADWRTVVHEMGHILDGSLKRLNNRVPLYSIRSAHIFDAGDGATGYARDRASSSEDFADSFLAVIKFGIYNNPSISEDRVKAMTALIQSYTNSDHTNSPGR
jgi:RHS repeat-associated protein